MNPKEKEDELFWARLFKRPVREFLLDRPTYPYCVPEPKVNFRLNFTE